MKESSRRLSLLSITTAMLASLSAGCGDDASDDGPPPTRVEIAFEAMVGDEPLVIGTTYEGLGISDSSLTADELAFYVHGVELVTGAGARIPITLDVDSPFQHDGHALLDFSRDELSGAPELTENRIVRGSVPAGEYEGLRFTLGVSEAKNHLEASVAPSPMNVASMFWSWTMGYIFLRFDGATDTLDGFRVHLGSTRCSGPEESPEQSVCQNKNTVLVEFEKFDADADVVVFDLARLLDRSDLESNQTETPPGCSSAPSDADCAPIFANFGLEHPEQGDLELMPGHAFRAASAR